MPSCAVWQQKSEPVRKGSNRVNRGGSWNNNARNCRVSNRNNNDPGNRNNNLGLRLALQLGLSTVEEQGGCRVPFAVTKGECRKRGSPIVAHEWCERGFLFFYCIMLRHMKCRRGT